MILSQATLNATIPKKVKFFSKEVVYDNYRSRSSFKDNIHKLKQLNPLFMKGGISTRCIQNKIVLPETFGVIRGKLVFKLINVTGDTFSTKGSRYQITYKC